MSGKPGLPMIVRFEKYYIPEPNSGCWIWLAGLNKYGYAHLKAPSPRGMVRAHRFAYEHFKGPIPKGLDLRHTCDMRCCVNPDHLVPGTRTDNMRDAIDRGRFCEGEKHWRTCLTADQVRAIRSDIRLAKEIAPIYGLSENHIRDIKRRRYWARLP